MGTKHLNLDYENFRSLEIQKQNECDHYRRRCLVTWRKATEELDLVQLCGRQRVLLVCDGMARPSAVWETACLLTMRGGDGTFSKLGDNTILWDARDDVIFGSLRCSRGDFRVCCAN